VTREPLPPAADTAYLTDALRRSGVLGDGMVSDAVWHLSEPTIRANKVCSGLMRGSLQSRKANHGQNHVDRTNRIDEYPRATGRTSAWR
jgi:hypothetical protein